MTGEQWLKLCLTKLSIDDSLSEYIKAVMESETQEGLEDFFEMYSSNTVLAIEVINEIKSKWYDYYPPPNKIETLIISSNQVISKERGNNKPKIITETLGKEEREVTLRLVKQMQELEIQAEIEAELAENVTAEDNADSLAGQNRMIVQNRIQKAQQNKEAIDKKHKDLSRAAAIADKKSKEDKKEERQRRALKGERRGNS